MPNIDTLSVTFSAKGTKTAVDNIKAMGLAIRGLATNINAIDTSKLGALANAMNNLKRSAPTKAQASRMTDFGKAMSAMAQSFETVNADKVNNIASSMSALKKTAPTKAQAERLGGFNTAVGSFASAINGVDGSKLDTFATGLEVIKKSTPTKSQTERLTAFASAVTELSNAIGAANIGEFSKDMSVLGGAVEQFKKSSVNSITNAVTAMKNMGQTAQQTATAINNATPKKSQDVKMGDNKGTLEQAKEMFAALDKVEIKATGIARIMEKLGLTTPTKKFKDLENQAEKVRQKYEELRTTLNKALQSGEIQTDSGEFRKKQAELDALKNKYSELIQKQRELAEEGGRFQLNPSISRSVDKLKSSFNGFQNILNGVSSGLKSISSFGDRVVGKLRSLGRAARDTKKESKSLVDVTKKLSNEFFRVSKMLKLMVTRMALRKVIAEVGNGFKSLALHSDEFNNSVSGMMNASKQLGYSFSAMVSPLINAFAPAITYIINLLIKLANIINQVFSALSGKTVWEKAKGFTDDWRKSIEEAGESGKQTAKELKKTVLGFDELNQLQDRNETSGGKSGEIKDMFETVEIENKWKRLADYIKKLAAKLFDPIKKAWQKVGDFVKKAWKYAMNEVLKLGKSVARDFWKVWNQDKTQKIFENILKIIGWIGVAVGNLAKRFREAWDHNDTGLKILMAIRDIILIVTEHLVRMAKATAEWADSLNFKPLLTAIKDWLESLKPVVDAIMGVLGDFYEIVVLRLAKWVIETGMPMLLKVFQDFNNQVDWDGLRDKLKTLWEHVEPFMETVGEGLILFIERCTTALANFLNSDTFTNFLTKIEGWMDSVTATDVADAIEKIVKFFIGVKIASMLLTIFTKIVAVVKVLGTVLQFVFANITLLAGVITAILSLRFTEHIMAMIDPGTYEKYDSFLGMFVLIYDTIDAIIGFVDLLIDKIKKLFSGDFIKNFDNLYAFLFEGGKFAPSPVLQILSNLTEAVRNVQDGTKDLNDIIEKTGESAEQATSKATDGINNMATAADNANTSMGNVDEGAKSFEERARAIAEESGKVSARLGDAKNSAGELSSTVNNTSDKLKAMEDRSIDLSNTLYNTSEEFRNLSNNIHDTKAAEATYKSTKDGISRYSEDINKALKGIDTSWIDKMFEDLNKDTIGDYKDFSTDVDSTTKDIQSYLDELDTTDIDKMFEEFETNTDTSMSDAKKVVEDNSREINKSLDTIKTGLTKEKWTFQGVADGLGETFRRAKDAIKKEWNQIAETLNGEHEVGGSKVKIDLPKFARGGFPEDGLFYANHSELVGKFSNGKNAVANNAQIIEGIANGVYQATVRANAQNNGNSKYISNTIVVDGEVIARTVTKAQERQNFRYSPSTI